MSMAENMREYWQRSMTRKKKPSTSGKTAAAAAPVCRTLPDLFRDQELRSVGLHGVSQEN